MRPHHHKGFLLFEVILALAIFSMVMVGLAQSMQLTLGSLTHARMESYVREELASRMALTQAQPASLKEGELRETADERGVTYTRTVEPLSLQTKEGFRLPTIYRVEWSANWLNGGEPMQKSYQVYLNAIPTNR
jgi:type II secretory pathway component PulJ